MRTLSLIAWLILCACASQLPSDVPRYGYRIVHTYPHDRLAFTEGSPRSGE
jgi:glutamine cyclotransferase